MEMLERKASKLEIYSFTSSIILHIIFVLIIIIPYYSKNEPIVGIDLGPGGNGGGPAGGGDEKIVEIQRVREFQFITEKIIQPAEPESELATPVVKKEKDKAKDQKQNPNAVKGNNPSGTGTGSGAGSGDGFGFGTGYGFDWGGRGTRRILRWQKPDFPADVAKSIDIKIRFIILPDGSVVSPIPLMKADTRLEDAAISSIKTWRFEPLKSTQPQFEQIVTITIPYRLE